MRIGLVGYGAMGRNHERVILAHKDHELAGIFDPRFTKADGHYFKASLYDIIDSGIDACVVSVPPHQTKLHSKLLACHKIPTLIEKPLAGCYQDAVEIVEAFEQTKTFVAVGYVERFNQSVIKARELLATKALGRILDISSSRLGYLGDRKPTIGVELDLLVHDLDLIRFLSEKKILEAQGIKTSFYQQDISDSAVVIGQLQDNVQFAIRANWISSFKQREFTITGERGTLILNTLDMGLRHVKNGTVESFWTELTSIRGFSQGDEVSYALNKLEPLKLQFDSFILGIGGKAVTCCGVDEAAELLRVIERIF
jgi:UDP-N-acetylglucosamine 3-dehydrogenase